MVETIERFGTFRGAKMLADWTDRIAGGQLPASQPPRPQGLERNVVITVWDWANPKAYLHDEVATDKRNPTVNAYGSLYGATENSTDFVPIFDPIKSVATTVKLPVRDPKTPSDDQRRPDGAVGVVGRGEAVECPDHSAQPDAR